jgi:hypothetical protein
VSIPDLSYTRRKAGIASLILASVYYVSLFLTLNSIAYNLRMVFMFGAFTVCVCFVLAFGFAVAAVILNRGRSLAGWTTILFYATLFAVALH